MVIIIITTVIVITTTEIEIEIEIEVDIEITTIIMIIFPAHAELGTCMTSLVSSEQPAEEQKVVMELPHSSAAQTSMRVAQKTVIGDLGGVCT